MQRLVDSHHGSGHFKIKVPMNEPGLAGPNIPPLASGCHWTCGPDGKMAPVQSIKSSLVSSFEFITSGISLTNWAVV